MSKVYRPTTKKFIEYCRGLIKDMKDAGTYKAERIITSPQSSLITANNKKVLNFCANNYLGFSDNKKLIEAAKKSLDKYGYGLSSVRFICGTQDIHKKLEKIITEYFKMEDTILYSSCFDANGGVFEGILGQDDAIVSDELNHASIIDGIRLSKPKKLKYKHMDMGDLDKCLSECKDTKFKLIVSDGVFSMDGDIAPLPKIVELAHKHDAMIFLDESHATGIFGKTGRGIPEYYNLEHEIDIINSTLGKSLGGATGGFTTGPREIIDILRNKGRPYLFSNSLAPSIVSGSIECFELLKDPSHLKRLQANTAKFRTRMGKAGFKILGNKDCAIVPVLLGDAKLATNMANEMLKEGIYVIGFSFPVVPKGQARIRVQLSAGHTLDQVDKCVDAFIKVGKNLGVIN